MTLASFYFKSPGDRLIRALVSPQHTALELECIARLLPNPRKRTVSPLLVFTSQNLRMKPGGGLRSVDVASPCVSLHLASGFYGRTSLLHSVPLTL
jgi:hypothetical protein